MKYMGSKSKTGKEIAQILNAIGGTVYVEPFMGSLSVAKHITLNPKLLADIHPELAGLYQRAFNGGVFAPDANHVTKEEYYEIKSAGPSHPYYALVGFCCSFRGKWWGGHATPQYAIRNGKQWSSDVNPIKAALKSIETCRANCGSAEFVCSSYSDLSIPDGALVYCDPPYKNTTHYGGTPKFDHDLFWEWAAQLSSRTNLFVSEAEAPEEWEDIFSVSLPNRMRHQKSSGTARTERLFVYKGNHAT